MLVKLLGIIDLLGAILLISLRFGLGEKIALVIAVILMIKALFFIKALASSVDFIVGIILLLAALGHYYSFTWLFSIWLLQKAVISFFS